ncbi:MAG TPA: sulfatase-like hydrolase/transferase [Bacteroidales bacterium]|nr:sulfatase-like hydrolase/transferase [Bacteroidales bacterium]HQI71095.1 sulfatase-like hydrolase/transferase [Bacteroidales bacterium]
MKKLFSLHNIYFELVIRIAILLILFTLCRIMFYIFNTDSFSVSTSEFFLLLIYGIRFDLSSIILVNSLYIFFQTLPINFRSNDIYQKILEILFFITNSLALLLNCADIAYYKYLFRRTNFDIIKSIFIGDDFRTVFWNYVADYWYIALIWLLMVVLMIFLYKKTKRVLVLRNNTWRQHLCAVIVFLAAMGLSVVAFRGGFQLRPISLVTAGEYTTAENVPLVINTPFSIYCTIEKQQLVEKKYLDEDVAKKIYNPVQHHVCHDAPMRNLNVAIIIVESLSKEYIGILNHDMEDQRYTGYTPFIDSLITKSLCFDNCFANSKRSIEGIPAILSGLPSLMDDAYLTSVFSGNKINSLPILLKKYGYTSMFFHGGKNGTLNFDAYAKMAGFNYYYGKNEYNNDADYDGNWGIYDEEFLKFAVNTLDTSRQPFIAALYTLSSHHPYSIPKKYRNKFKKGALEIHESIMYTDYSLKEFFKACSSQSWYDSTLFIITADHSSLAGTPYYMNNAGSYAIPLIFYLPNSNLQGINHTICQQADIMSSVLDFINFKEKYTTFGTSVFDSTAAHFSVSYSNNNYRIIKDSFLLQFNGEKGQDMYNILEDKFLNNNLYYKNKNKQTSLEDFLKAYLQTYDARIIKNQLTDTND